MFVFPDLGSKGQPLAGDWSRQEIGGPEDLGLLYPEPTSLDFRLDRLVGDVVGDDRESGTLSFAGK